MVSPPCTAAIAPVLLCGADIFTAIAIHRPKNGACIAADNNLDSNNTSKLGAVAAIILLITNKAISPTRSGLGENFNVTILRIGPNTATLIA